MLLEVLAGRGPDLLGDLFNLCQPGQGRGEARPVEHQLPGFHLVVREQVAGQALGFSSDDRERARVLLERGNGGRFSIDDAGPRANVRLGERRVPHLVAGDGGFFIGNRPRHFTLVEDQLEGVGHQAEHRPAAGAVDHCDVVDFDVLLASVEVLAVRVARLHHHGGRVADGDLYGPIVDAALELLVPTP